MRKIPFGAAAAFLPSPTPPILSLDRLALLDSALNNAVRRAGLILIGIAVGPSGTWGDTARVSLVADYQSGPGSAGSWQLFGRIEETASGESGQFGFSAIRFFLTGVDYGTNGDAIVPALNIGALDPLNAGLPSERPPALLRGDGVIDFIYGQDLSESNGNSVVFGVGTTGDTLLASGTFSAGMSPGFGRDGAVADAARTQALFLPTGSTPITSPVLRADQTLTRVLDNVSTLGDYTGDGLVNAADYTEWRDHLGSTVDLAADGDGDQIVDADDYLVWAEGYGGAGGARAIPEPTPWLLLAVGIVAMTMSAERHVARVSDT